MEFESLIQQPESRRDTQWEGQFLQTFPQMKVELESDQAKAGPDGWPYFFVKTAPDGSEPVKDILEWLAGRGIGLVVNAHKMMPDYVFTYGMLWNFVETGRFLEPQIERPAGSVTYSPDKPLVVGPPSEKYLPLYVREVLKEFLTAQGYLAPRVLVVSSQDYKEVDLVFSTESLNSLPTDQHKVLAEQLAWFLPLHYNLVLGSEQGMPPFHAL